MFQKGARRKWWAPFFIAVSGMHGGQGDYSCTSPPTFGPPLALKGIGMVGGVA